MWHCNIYLFYLLTCALIEGMTLPFEIMMNM